MPLQIWLAIFIAFILPFWILREGWMMYKAFLKKDKDKKWENTPYHLLIFFIILLLIVISMDGGLYAR